MKISQAIDKLRARSISYFNSIFLSFFIYLNNERTGVVDHCPLSPFVSISHINLYLNIVIKRPPPFWRNSSQWARASTLTRFLDHTQRRTTVGRTRLDEGSARRRDLYLTTHDTHNRQISMHPVEFEPSISAGERPQSYALDRAVTGTGRNLFTYLLYLFTYYLRTYSQRA
jgi:hypothetical protein